MRKVIISSLLSLGLLAPMASVNAHKYELIVNGNSTLKVAREALKQGRFVKAIALYKRALRWVPSATGKVWAYNDLCVAHYLKTDLKEALGYCNQAIKLAPNKWIGHNNRANVLIAAGFVEEAQKAYEKALRLNPKSTIIQANLALMIDNKTGVLPDVTPFQIMKKKKNKNPADSFVTAELLD
jgi:tetratricopeptide (TPR) repeat protein